MIENKMVAFQVEKSAEEKEQIELKEGEEKKDDSNEKGKYFFLKKLKNIKNVHVKNECKFFLKKLKWAA